MAENAVATEKTEANKVEMTQFTARIPKDQFERLVNGERFDKRMEKPEYFQHIFNTYEQVSADR